jgi:hypothetical protein
MREKQCLKGIFLFDLFVVYGKRKHKGDGDIVKKHLLRVGQIEGMQRAEGPGQGEHRRIGLHEGRSRLEQ